MSSKSPASELPLAAQEPSRPNLLIVGCGYLGLRVGRQAKAAGWNVAATTRSRFGELRNEGFQPISFDWNDSRDLLALARHVSELDVDRILIAVSYDRNSRVDRYASQVDGLSRLLQTVVATSQHLARPIPDVAYVSTTGVYHQTGGMWVNEQSTTRPTREGGRAHLQAEAKLRVQLGHEPWTILRLSGIYGPGRVPRAADVRDGRAITSPADGYLNLTHVEDAASAVIATLSWQDRNPQRNRQRLYLVSDDEPVIRRRFYEEIAHQTRSPEPTFVKPAADSGVHFRSETDKRVCNRKLKRDLLPTLRYPTYREGLRHVLEH